MNNTQQSFSDKKDSSTKFTLQRYHNGATINFQTAFMKGIYKRKLFSYRLKFNTQYNAYETLTFEKKKNNNI